MEGRESNRLESVRIDSNRFESVRIGSNRLESVRIDSNRLESTRIGSNRFESTRIKRVANKSQAGSVTCDKTSLYKLHRETDKGVL
ncbi:unnamed protein product [Caenorhabditis angaria]|uniref:Uncharacterized protein n=1 Tax=Caenorhabditis angaria TaxID=860376 RepID=A0A9P1N4W7_9PELO|nr:unnamed protein product [Caenorhabditis angaria]